MPFRFSIPILIVGLGVAGSSLGAVEQGEPNGVPATGAAAQSEPAISKITEDDLVEDARTTRTVLTNGLGRALRRYSPLAGIDKKNVDRLEPVWSISLGKRTQSSQPLIVDGVIYVTSPPGRLHAIDADDGREIWRHEPDLQETPSRCCGTNLGAAILGKKIYYVTPDSRLLALSREDGTVAWSAKLRQGTPEGGYVAAPLIVAGLVLTGNAAGTPGTVGTIRAHDAETGELVWSRPVIEGHSGQFEGRETTSTGTPNASWPGETWKTGGGAVWLGGSYDGQTNTVVFGTGHPDPANPYRRNAAVSAQGDLGDKEGTAGTSDNLYAASRLGLNPENGEIKWYFQTTPRDAWGFDGVSEVIPFEGSDGVSYWATADNNGFFYVLNRDDGSFVRARPFLDGITWATGINEDGRPIVVSSNRPDNPFETPEEAEPSKSRVVPAPLPGRTWMPMTYSKRTGLFYIPANAWATALSYPAPEEADGSPAALTPVSEDYVGTVAAMDPISGELRWRYKSQSPIWSGTLSTGGGLVFVGTSKGELLALDDETGEVLWTFQAEAGISGQPVTWEQGGRQFLAVTIGIGDMEPLWGENIARRYEPPGSSGALIVFALPRE